jgi:hypothetical protein
MTGRSFPWGNCVSLRESQYMLDDVVCCGGHVATGVSGERCAVQTKSFWLIKIIKCNFGGWSSQFVERSAGPLYMC